MGRKILELAPQRKGVAAFVSNAVAGTKALGTSASTIIDARFLASP